MRKTHRMSQLHPCSNHDMIQLHALQGQECHLGHRHRCSHYHASWQSQDSFKYTDVGAHPQDLIKSSSERATSDSYRCTKKSSNTITLWFAYKPPPMHSRKPLHTDLLNLKISLSYYVLGWVPAGYRWCVHNVAHGEGLFTKQQAGSRAIARAGGIPQHSGRANNCFHHSHMQYTSQH